MPPTRKTFENRSLRLECGVPASKVVLKNARVVEGLSQLTETKIEMLCADEQVNLQKFVGEPMIVTLDEETKGGKVEHHFSGTCISVEFVGYYQGDLHLVAEVRPWLWFLTRTRENRIFQEQTAPDIIKSVLGDYGFTGDLTERLQESYEVRQYCVQYRETDFDFISRLMEEEGIYYFFRQEEKKLKLVLADGVQAHKTAEGKAEIPFFFREQKGYRRDQDHIFEWSGQTSVTSGKVTLEDYDFEKPKSDLKKVKAIPLGTHGHKKYEVYDYPGHYRVPGLGDARARVRMEAEAARHLRSRALGNPRGLRAGNTFTLTEHSRDEENQEYMTVSMVHHLQIETDYEDSEVRQNPFMEKDDSPGARNPEEGRHDTYRCEFEVIPGKVPFRAPLVTRWPAISGLHTAVVTGPGGEEIYTDKYGRIKVQFHWDRLGKKDEMTTCFVRCVMPWTGKNWGMIAIPRIGQEVVIQFEEGDPDRPICTGMLYNGDCMPPYDLPANMTQTGIVTRSTKSGSQETYNELIFEDKKDEEFIRVHSEKDYFQTVENDAVIEIGLEKTDPGDLTQTIHRHKTETLKTGDKTLTVETGSEYRTIATDKVEDIGNDDTLTVGNNRNMDISADLTEKVGGNQDTSVTGNLDLAVTGDISESSNGSIDIKALSKIKLSVGGSSITIDNSGITIKAPMVTVAAQTKAEVKGSAVLILKGGMTMIN